MGGLPLGSVKFITDEMQLVALLSPYKVPKTLPLFQQANNLDEY
jgi:hypothetical protein